MCKAPYYEEGLVVGEVRQAQIKRKRISSTLLRDEDLDLTINELERIRERVRLTEHKKPKSAPVRRASRRATRG